MSSPSMFSKRDLLIVTHHQKQKAFAALLEAHIGVRTQLSYKINTDDYGTFSGEVARQGTALEAALRKCKAGLEAHNLDLGIASEGSYGPDPLIGFLPMAQETVVLLDLKNELQISEAIVSYDTNYQTKELQHLEELLHFARALGFPKQGVILHAMNQENRLKTLKDFVDFSDLQKGYNQLRRLGDSTTIIRADTDMRAYLNPIRMQLLTELAQRLIATIKRTCPKCDAPGFHVKKSVKGLLCQNCKMPTNSTLYQVWGCIKCTHQEEIYYPKGNAFEDAAYCDFCNP